MSQTSSNPAEDQHFQHYTLKHRVVSWVSRNLFDQYTYKVQHGLLQGLKRKGGLGWIPQAFSKSIETPEIEFWRKLPLAGLTVYDVGSFEGLLALYFASRAKQVICYEPNSRNHRRLLDNLKLNGFSNVTVRNLGIGEPQEIQLTWNPAMPGGASAETATAEHLRDTVAGAQMETIPITTLDQDAAENTLPAPDLIKVDIEGWELQALRGAKGLLGRFRPAPAIEHVEIGQRVTSANCQLAVEGHLYCPRIIPVAGS